MPGLKYPKRLTRRLGVLCTLEGALVLIVEIGISVLVRGFIFDPLVLWIIYYGRTLKTENRKPTLWLGVFVAFHLILFLLGGIVFVSGNQAKGETIAAASLFLGGGGAVVVVAGATLAALVRARAAAPLTSSSCEECGYDMRASPDRCSECGWIGYRPGPEQFADQLRAITDPEHRS